MSVPSVVSGSELSVPSVVSGSELPQRRIDRPGRARVSIGVPVFNGARYLEDCLDSLVAQTYGDLEILISDNASTDRTPAICRAYCERDPRIRYYRQQQNIGAAANYNFLVREATGEFFKWAAHDDLCAPALVARCVAALDASPTAVLAFGRTGFIDDAGAPLHGYDVPIRWSNHEAAFDRLREQLAIPGAALQHMCTRQFGVLRRGALLRTSLIRSHPASDLVLMLELALLGGLVEVEERLFFVRLHESSSLRANQSATDVARWYDPRSGDRYPLRWTRVLTGYGGAVLSSSLSRREKVGGLLLIARWLMVDENWRIIGGELKRRLFGLVQQYHPSRGVQLFESGRWLGERYKERPNIIWFRLGDCSLMRRSPPAESHRPNRSMYGRRVSRTTNASTAVKRPRAFRLGRTLFEDTHDR